MITENDLQNAWADATAHLTPEEREAVSKATPEQWIKALVACVNDPEFWQRIGAAFIEGVAQGFADWVANR